MAPESYGSGDSGGEAIGPPAAVPLFAEPVRLTEVDSTNRHLAELARAGAPEGSAVLAQTQTAGRGRLERRWLDPPGGSVLCSLLFRPGPRLLESRLHLVAWSVALAAAEAAEEVASVTLAFKWPNDLVQSGPAALKVGGMLSETVAPDALVVGIGVNCNWPDDWPPPELSEEATSLDRLAGRPVDRAAFEGALLRRAGERYASLVAPGDSREGAREIASDFRRKLSSIGSLVRVTTPEETFTGRALDVDESGHLLVDVGACIRIVDAGDVVHLRPLGRERRERSQG